MSPQLLITTNDADFFGFDEFGVCEDKVSKYEQADHLTVFDATATSGTLLDTDLLLMRNHSFNFLPDLSFFENTNMSVYDS